MGIVRRTTVRLSSCQMQRTTAPIPLARGREKRVAYNRICSFKRVWLTVMSNDWRLFFVFYLSGSDHVVNNVFQSSSSMSRHQSGTAVRIVVFKDCTNLKCGRFLARVTVPRMRRRITPYVKRCTIVSVRVGRIHTGASSSFGTTRASLVRSKGIPRKETWRTHPQSVFELAVGSSCSRLNRYYVEECHAQNKYSAYTVKRRETLTLGTTKNSNEWSKSRLRQRNTVTAAHRRVVF